MFGDETELQVFKEPGRNAQAKSYVWAQMTDGLGKNGTGPLIRLFTYSSMSVPGSRSKCDPDPGRNRLEKGRAVVSKTTPPGLNQINESSTIY